MARRGCHCQWGESPSNATNTHTHTHTSKQRKHTKKKLRKKDNHKFNKHCKEHGSPIHWLLWFNTAAGVHGIAAGICYRTQTPLIRFVVDLFTTSCTTNPQDLYMSRCCQFVVDSTANPQQIELVKFGFWQVVDLSWRCSRSQRAVVSRDDYVIIRHTHIEDGRYWRKR